MTTTCHDRMPTRETTMTTMFVNLPVTDLERAKAFYTALGFTINPLFTDHNAACVVVEEDHSYFMLLSARVLPDLHRAADRRPGDNPAVVDGDLPRQPRGGRHGRRPPASPRAAPSRSPPPTTASCTSASSPTPTATSSSSAGWTRSPPRRAPRPSRPAGLRSMAARDYGQYCGDHAGPRARRRALGAAHRPRPARRAAPLRRARRGAPAHPEQHPRGAAQGAAGGRGHPPRAALARHRLRADAVRPRARAGRARARRLGLQGDGRTARGAGHHPRLDDDGRCAPPSGRRSRRDLPATAYAAQLRSRRSAHPGGRARPSR